MKVHSVQFFPDHCLVYVTAMQFVIICIWAIWYAAIWHGL